MGMLAIGAGGLEVAMATAGEHSNVPMPQIRGVRLTGRLRLAGSRLPRGAKKFVRTAATLQRPAAVPRDAKEPMQTRNAGICRFPE